MRTTITRPARRDGARPGRGVPAGPGRPGAVRGEAAGGGDLGAGDLLRAADRRALRALRRPGHPAGSTDGPPCRLAAARATCASSSSASRRRPTSPRSPASADVVARIGPRRLGRRAGAHRRRRPHPPALAARHRSVAGAAARPPRHGLADRDRWRRTRASVDGRRAARPGLLRHEGRSGRWRSTPWPRWTTATASRCWSPATRRSARRPRGRSSRRRPGRPSAALVLEASADGGALKTARKGVSLYEVRVLGRAAHAGLEPERGRQRRPSSSRTRCWRSRRSATRPRGTTVTPTVMRRRHDDQHGARRRVASPSTSGSGPPAEQDRVDAAMRSLRTVAPRRVAGGAPAAPTDRRWRPRPRPAPVRAGARCSPRGSVLPRADGGRRRRRLRRQLHRRRRHADPRRPRCRRGGAHADDEHVLVDALPGRTALLAALVADLLADPTTASRRRVPPTMTSPEADSWILDAADASARRDQAVRRPTPQPSPPASPVREVTDLAELRTWCGCRGDLGPRRNPPMTVELLRAFTKAGNYVARGVRRTADDGRRLRRLLPRRPAERRPAQPHRRGRARP